MPSFRNLLSWLVPLKLQNMLLVRGQNYLLATEHYRALDSLMSERQVLRAEKAEALTRADLREAELDAARAKFQLVGKVNEALQAKYEAACIVLHLQKQKQTSYERKVYAASMGGMILDNQEEISRIAQAAQKAINTIKDI